VTVRDDVNVVVETVTEVVLVRVQLSVREDRLLEMVKDVVLVQELVLV